MVKASTSRAEYPGFECSLHRDFFGVKSYQWLKNWHSSGYPLPGAWCYRVSAGTGWPSVSILWLGEMESLVCNFLLSVVARKISEQIRPWDTLACCWEVKQPTIFYRVLQDKCDWYFSFSYYSPQLWNSLPFYILGRLLPSNPVWKPFTSSITASNSVTASSARRWGGSR